MLNRKHWFFYLIIHHFWLFCWYFSCL